MRLSSAGFSPPPQEGKHFISSSSSSIFHLFFEIFTSQPFCKLVLATSTILGGLECVFFVLICLAMPMKSFVRLTWLVRDVKIESFGLWFSLVYAIAQGSEKKVFDGYKILDLAGLCQNECVVLVWALFIPCFDDIGGGILQGKIEF